MAGSITNKPLVVHVVYNSAAGLFPGDSAEQIMTSFARHPHVNCAVHACDDPGALLATVRKVVEQKADIVAAAGGDGTISSVADLLVGTDAALGALPLGTLNHFAKDLGVPMDLDRAVDTICSGKTVAVDVGEVNGRYFVNNVSLGAYPKAVALRGRWRKFIGKWPAMVLAVIVVSFRMPWLRVRMEWGGDRSKRFAPLLFVGNNPYETGWPEVGTRAGLNRGVLWLMLLKKMSFARMLKLAVLALCDRIWEAEELEIVESRELTIHTSRRRLRIALDGETFKHNTPLVFRSHPAGLRVRVPAEAAQDGEE